MPMMGSNGHSFDDDSFDIGHTRVAISCLFLERLCAVFPRHNAAVRPIAEAIMRSIFVPDTATTRELVGSLDCPITVDSSVSLDMVELLRPYARKTYATAFTSISTMLKRFSKTSHSLEVRLKRQAQVFERTLAHWRRTLLRSVFVAWRSTIRRRVYLRGKYRAIFLRLREDECKARAIRLWHQRSQRLRKTALADAAMQQEMNKMKTTTENLQQQIASLLDQNATLGRDVADLERQRQLLQQEMAERENFVIDMNHRTAEAERLGTELINSVLMVQDPPAAATPLESLVRWGHEVIEVHGSVDGQLQPLSCLLSDEVALPNFSFSALGTILGAFEVDGAPPREAILQMHINPDAAPQLLINFYGRVTQRPSIVSEAHLKSRQRGVLLLFLASLMRFASSWLFGPPPMNLRAKMAAKAAATAAAVSSSAASNTNMFALDSVPSQFGNSSGMKQRTSNNNNSSSTSTYSAPPALPKDTSSSTWMERVRTQQRWVVVSLSALNAALLVASDRPQVLSADEQEDEAKYCGLSASMLAELFPTAEMMEDRLPQVVKCVRHVFPELRKLYLTYSSPALSVEECYRLLKDSRLAGMNVDQISRKKLQTVCAMARKLTAIPLPVTPTSASAQSPPGAAASAVVSVSNARPESSPLGGGGMPPPPHHTATSDLSPMQFVITVMHVAMFEHRRQMRLDNPEAVSFEPFMLENAVRSMRDHALHSDMDGFRHIMRHPLAQAVISRHKVALRRVFRHFANCDDGESVNKNALHQMARAGSWLNKTVTIETLNDIFRRVQRSSADAGSGVDMMSSLSPIKSGNGSDVIDLSEWIECLGAVSNFTFPSPFKPLWEKLGAFIEDKVLVLL